MNELARQANLLGTLSLAVADRMRDATRARAASSGETAAALIATATFLEGATIEELSNSLGLTHSATVRLADKLESRGEVVRRPGRDRRSVSLRATAKGSRAAASILGARAEVMERAMGSLTRAEREELARLNAKMLGGLVDAGATPVNVCRMCDAEACGHESGHCPVTEAARALREG